MRVKLSDQGNPAVDEKKYTAAGIFMQAGKKMTTIRCPFCTEQADTNVAVLKGIGGRCQCGAVFGVKGLALRAREKV